MDNLHNLAEDCGEITEADIREADLGPEVHYLH